MSVITIEVINVGKPDTIPTKNGKSYQSVEVAYKKDGKVEGKKILSFVNPSVFKTIQTFEVGKTYNINTEKDEKGYWQWTGIVDESASTGGTSAAKSGGKAISNYETREEREAKQKYIIRQNALTNAVAFSEAGVSVQEVLATASAFESWVLAAVDNVETLTNDIPD